MFDKLDSNILQKIWRTFFCLEVNNILNSQVLFVDFGRHGGIFSLDFFFILPRLLLIVFGAALAIFCSEEKSLVYLPKTLSFLFCGEVAFFFLS